MQWLARAFASAFVRKLGFAAAVALLAVASQCAQAIGTIPLPPVAYVPGGNPPSGTEASTAAGACQAYVAQSEAIHWFASPVVYVAVGFAGNGSGGTCSFTYGPSATAGTAGWQFKQTCPANSTGPGGILPNQFCTCSGSFVPNANSTACVVPDVCAATLAKAMGSGGQEFSVPASGPSAPVMTCTNSCQYIPRSTGPGGGMVSKLGASYFYIGMDAAQWVGTGVSCVAAVVGSSGTQNNPPQPDPVPLAPGTCPGTVNGVTVIVPCDSSTTNSATGPAGSASGASSSASSPSGAVANTSNKNTETTCTTTSCTTTVTKTTNNPDGTTTTQKDTETEDKGDFCAEHPGSPQCEDEEDPSDPCDDAPDRAGCKNLGTLEATPLQNVNVALAITPSTGYGPSNATCPAPQTATLLGHTYSFSWQPFCDLAVGIRPVVLALAWLSAAIGFLGLSRKGN